MPSDVSDIRRAIEAYIEIVESIGILGAREGHSQGRLD